MNVSLNKVYKIKKEATKIIQGSYVDQYKLLFDYCEEIRRSNPGTTIYVDAPLDSHSGYRVFWRIYVCLTALRDGFLAGCRRVIGLDGTFLKGPHPGIFIDSCGN